MNSRFKYKDIISPISFVNEVWMPMSKLVHPNLLPYYYVSNYGRIYSTATRHCLRGAFDTNGYLYVSLHVEDGTEYLGKINHKYQKELIE